MKQPVRLADELQRRWYTPAESPPWWTLPFAGLYGAVVRVRRALYACGVLRIVRLPVPTVVVGNLVAGGAGKTPLVIALIEGLRARGFRPGVVSRGYGGSDRSPRLLDQAPDPLAVGDEPALIRLRTGAPVAVGAARVAAARLLPGAGADVVIADDGLQHHALGRDVEICVIDGTRRFGNGRLLPAGPLREPVVRLRSVDFTVCNGGAVVPGEIPMRLVATDAVSIADPGERRSLAGFAGERVHAVAGIGNPARFFATLRGAGIDALPNPFPDHHRYTSAELSFGDGLPILMTEKDAVKCRSFARSGWWYVPVDAVLPDAFFEGVAGRVHAAGDSATSGRSRGRR